MTLTNEPAVSTHFGEWAAGVARLIDSAERSDNFKVLYDELSRFCSFDNLIVYEFNGAATPRFIGSNLPETRLVTQMQDFTDGLFLLDPFVIEAQRGSVGVLRLREIMPDNFIESEFYRHHYTHTNVLDEVRFIVPLDRGRTIHVFVERENDRQIFSTSEFATLQAFLPIVEIFVRLRMRRLDSKREASAQARIVLDIPTRIRAMGNLTSRECQVIELLLRGHANKSIANALSIEAGTVTNHKRNIYAKLGVHSQAQLFESFLRTIAAL